MPEMFGVMSLATVVMVGINMFSDVGLRQVVVRSRHGAQPDFLNTVWTIQIVRGAVVALILLALACLTAALTKANFFPETSAYANPALPWVLAGLAITAVLQGFESTKLLIAQRDMEIHRTTAIELISQLASLIVMVVYALYSPTVFALVAGAIMAGAVRTAATHWALPGGSNGLCWHAPSVKEIKDLGSWVFLTSILGFLATSGDRLIFGWLLTSEQMGYYALATLLVLAVHDVANKLISNVIFPVLSAVYRERPHDISASLHKIRWPVDAICLTSAGMIYISSDTLIQVMYGDRYQEAAHYLQIFSLTLISIRYSMVSQVFFVMGRPKVMFHIQIMRLITLFVGVPVGFGLWGVEGALWGAVCSFWVSMIFSLTSLMPKNKLDNYPREALLLAFGLFGAAAGWVINSVYRTFS